MTNLEKLDKGVHTVEPNRRASDEAQTTSTESEHTTSICVYGVNETIETNDKPNPNQLPFDDVEVSSTTAEEDALYKMKTNGPTEIFSPSKIEFKRMKHRSRKCRYTIGSPRVNKVYRSYNKKKKPKYPESEIQTNKLPRSNEDNTILSRLRRSLAKMQGNSMPGEKQSPRPPGNNDPERIDIYYFDHGNAAYFQTTDCPPAILSEMLAQQTTYYATRFWAEIFGSIHIGITFFITFFLQTYRFILYSIVRAIIVGFFQMTSDYLIKPILTVVFNGILQPILILMYNILSSIKDMLEPVAETIGHFLSPIAMLLKSIRIIIVRNNKTIIKKRELDV